MHLQTSEASLHLEFFASPPPPSPIPCLRTGMQGINSSHSGNFKNIGQTGSKKKITYNTWSSNYKMLALYGMKRKFDKQ